MLNQHLLAGQTLPRWGEARGYVNWATLGFLRHKRSLIAAVRYTWRIENEERSGDAAAFSSDASLHKPPAREGTSLPFPFHVTQISQSFEMARNSHGRLRRGGRWEKNVAATKNSSAHFGHLE